ncbi:MAG: Crp/Fnr family transcriptional regulator [Caldilineaceae bacterium]
MNHSIFESSRGGSNRASGHTITQIGQNSYMTGAQTQKEESGGYNVMHALNLLRSEEPAFDKAIRIRHITRGKVVATAHELAEKMYVLMSGKVNLVCKNSEGRRLVITTLEPGSIFGEGALHQQSDPSVFAEAAEDVAIWMIPASEARSMTTQYPILGWGLLQTYGQRLLQVENNLEDVAYKKLPERLAALLLEMANNQEGVIKGVSHQALADHLGTYRETVSAILREFKRQEIVELGYRRITILDLELLKETAGIWEW